MSKNSKWMTTNMTISYLTLSLVAGIALGYIAYQQLSEPFISGRTNSSVDLLDLAKHHKLLLEIPPRANASNYIHTKTFTIRGDTREILFMHPPSSALFDGRLTDEMHLEFAIGIDPDVWDNSGDGVEFQVEVRDSSASTIIFSNYIDPKRNISDRRWIETSLDLSRFAFQRIQLVLRTLPGASEEHDWAGWANPRIIFKNP
jgi:hypothetical protein